MVMTVTVVMVVMAMVVVAMAVTVVVVIAMAIAAMVVMNYRVEDGVLLPVIMAAGGIAGHTLEAMGSRTRCWIDGRAAAVEGSYHWA